MSAARLLASLALACCAATPAPTQSIYERYHFGVFAGTMAGGNVDGAGNAARLLRPTGLAVDARGNLYVADAANQTIRKVTPAGVVFTLAGQGRIFGFADGQASDALFNSPSGCTVTGSGNVYVADTGNHLIRKISPTGAVSTVAGRPGQAGSTDGTGSAAAFNQPFDVASDNNGNLFVADTSNHTIRKVTADAAVTTIAGVAGVAGSADGSTAMALFRTPAGMALDDAGNIYVADTGNHTIRKISPAGFVSTVAGLPGQIGSTDGRGSAARFNRPHQLAFDRGGNLLIADSGNHTLRQLASDGTVSTVAGKAGAAGALDGAFETARFSGAKGIAVAGTGVIYVGDTNNNTIRLLADRTVTTLAGTARSSAGIDDGPRETARFYQPYDVARDFEGNFFVADLASHTIRKINRDGVVSTVAGSAGIPGSADGVGSAARFNSPTGIAVGADATIYVADGDNSTIRKITPAGVVTTLAGTAGTAGGNDGIGQAASFRFPLGLAVDPAGNIYVADASAHTIRKVTPAGAVTTVAGSYLEFGDRDGTGASARFNSPRDVAVDSRGNLLVADGSNYSVRKITPDGVVTTIAGHGRSAMIDGWAQDAQFSYPEGIAVDSRDNIYVSEKGYETVRKISADGFVTTLAGVPDKFGSRTGTGSAALFDFPRGLAVDPAGNIYLADTFNNTIRIGGPTALSQMLNISTRARVAPGDSTLIGGVIVTGSVPKRVLIRAIGPSLPNSDVSGSLRDPVLELRDASGALLAYNDNWRNAANASEIEATGAAPSDELESAILMALPAGSACTATVRGNGETEGVAVVELYDLAPRADALLANISTRGFVGAGDDVMIAGVIVGGEPGAGTILLRAIGPSLGDSGVANALVDPTLTLYDANGALVAANDNWKQTDRRNIELTGIPPESDAESAIFGRFAPGAYTAVVRGSGGGTGVALVEAYNLPW